jgi:hypothetical protein
MSQVNWMREGLVLLVAVLALLVVWQAQPQSTDEPLMRVLISRFPECLIALAVLVYAYARTIFNDAKVVLRGYAFWTGGLLLGAALIITNNIVALLSSIPAVLLFQFLGGLCEAGAKDACLQVSDETKEIIRSYLFSMSTFLVAVPVTFLFAFRSGHWISKMVEPKPVLAILVTGLTYFAISRAAAEFSSHEIVEYTLELNRYSRIEALIYTASFASAYMVAVSFGYMAGAVGQARIAGEAARLIGGLSAYERAATLKDLRTRVRR